MRARPGLASPRSARPDRRRGAGHGGGDAGRRRDRAARPARELAAKRRDEDAAGRPARRGGELRQARLPHSCRLSARRARRCCSGPSSSSASGSARSWRCSDTRTRVGRGQLLLSPAAEGSSDRVRPLRRRAPTRSAPAGPGTRSARSTATEYARAAVPFTIGRAPVRARRPQADRRDPARRQRRPHGVPDAPRSWRSRSR